MLSLNQYFKKNLPALKGRLFKLLYTSRRLKVGKGFKCDKFPELLIDKGCKINIGDNVTLRRNVELRAHGESSTIEIANNCRIDRGVRLLCANNSNLKLGNNTRVGLYSVFNGGDDITIGNSCLISGFVYLQTSMHRHMSTKKIQEQGFDHSPVKLDDDVWIGAHAVILPGCNLGKGAVVGSNAVVTKSVGANEVVGGIPARLIKKRDDDE